jgi:hypothetical protein
MWKELIVGFILVLQIISLVMSIVTKDTNYALMTVVLMVWIFILWEIDNINNK